MRFSQRAEWTAGSQCSLSWKRYQCPLRHHKRQTYRKWQNFLESEADTGQGTQIIVTESEHCHQHCCKLNCLIMSDCIRETTPLPVLTCSPVRQGWRSPGFVVSRASTLSSSSSDNSPSSSSPSVDSRCSSPLPGEPAGPPHPGSHDDPRPQSAR